MNINEANSIVADLLDEETAEEYLHRLPDFYDHAQKQIATTVGYIERVIDFTPESDGEVDVSALLLEKTGKQLYRVARVISGGSAANVYQSVYDLKAGTRYRFLCYVYPETITDETDENYEFEVPQEALPAITYYAAAKAVGADSDKSQYYLLMEQYNNILQNMYEAKNDSVSVNVVRLGGNVNGI